MAAGMPAVLSRIADRRSSASPLAMIAYGGVYPPLALPPPLGKDGQGCHGLSHVPFCLFRIQFVVVAQAPKGFLTAVT